ncbi:type I methionyl aminopeptidase [Candidatus Woesebacteria bacterium RIFCSPLOWO2_01_FULL_39_23]|uniref:Methionine aminopeptidase n=2 Tax=Microgenomates group TaxID=1794810 RepID=A0A0H4T7C6_9BACT|nr:methionine aminopeptidase, methionyl aminopeptidase [uncultured Microgenomates bacterium Rifle_16ft_4_minimus_37633]OGM13893.1 MAG: type I methionyl aminopeptidase [Candidatus Woesebacteria bacterium RBG_16_40_11]OGM27845.1 MAG: type I methionyl aminopeptidase [Candidatus Woesebacteria bacterium RIFCSPHIGHO2_01_FULL_40_22]OGM62267.1 MAG: type I methionyl aminopeptidase [Candidatus Woesebacteria bacterium RIFCSPLOWO2_01_FULL_39_23]
MNKKNILTKSEKEIAIMIEGGRKLAEVKKRLAESVEIGGNAKNIEDVATDLIEKNGGKPSFRMVPNYSWATCVNINEGVVHGIPRPEIVFKKGDVVSVDVGLFYKGFHTDTSFTVGLGVSAEMEKFLETGKKALSMAISATKAGGRIYDISQAIETTLVSQGYHAVSALIGHGVGRELHEEPQIPGFTQGERGDSPIIPIGATLAIEVIYTMGSPNIMVGRDGWTIYMRDGKISALYEDTVAVTKEGTILLT